MFNSPILVKPISDYIFPKGVTCQYLQCVSLQRSENLPV